MRVTLPYRTGKIHLVEHLEDAADCVDRHAHVSLNRDELHWIEPYIRAIKQEPIAISNLRRLVGEVNASYGVHRAGDSRVADEVVHLLSRGRLIAVACRLETPAPAATLISEGDRFHIGVGIAHAADCTYQGSHRIYRQEGYQATKSLLEKLLGGSDGVKEARRLVSGQPDLRDLAGETSSASFVDRLASLVLSGRLALIECRTTQFTYAGGVEQGLDSGRVGARRKPAETPPPDKTDLTEEQLKTWIEIKLVDQNGKPVPNEKYELTLPDGTVMQGSLDAQGRARYDNLDPGKCKVAFPAIDGREWKPA